MNSSKFHTPPDSSIFLFIPSDSSNFHIPLISCLTFWFPKYRFRCYRKRSSFCFRCYRKHNSYFTHCLGPRARGILKKVFLCEGAGVPIAAIASNSLNIDSGFENFAFFLARDLFNQIVNLVCTRSNRSVFCS